MKMNVATKETQMRGPRNDCPEEKSCHEGKLRGQHAGPLELQTFKPPHV